MPDRRNLPSKTGKMKKIAAIKQFVRLLFGANVTGFIILSISTALAQTAIPAPPSATKQSVSSLAKLPRESLPKGFFYDWCGEDSFLMEDGKEFLLFGSDLKRGVAVPVVPNRVQCDASASRRLGFRTS